MTFKDLLSNLWGHARYAGKAIMAAVAIAVPELIDAWAVDLTAAFQLWSQGILATLAVYFTKNAPTTAG